jgi:hypothetical protein
VSESPPWITVVTPELAAPPEPSPLLSPFRRGSTEGTREREEADGVGCITGEAIAGEVLAGQTAGHRGLSGLTSGARPSVRTERESELSQPSEEWEASGPRSVDKLGH